MILYKYLSFDAGWKIIESSTVGFSQPRHFNDPFDMPAYPRERGQNPNEDMFSEIRVMAKERIWGDNTGILSLTRTSQNPLMWAHYAEHHKGMVLGFDVAAMGLTDEEKNLIPAQYGSVIYASGRPTHPFAEKSRKGIAVGATHYFPQDHYEILQRLFLHKPICWSYEEEVRVVKCIKDVSSEGSDTPSGYFRIKDVNGRPLYLLTFPTEALREIYFGFRLDIQKADEFYYKAKEQYPHVSVFECHLTPDTFAVGAKKYSTIAESTE